MDFLLRLNFKEKKAKLECSKCTVSEALKKLRVLRETVLVKKNGKLVCDEETLKQGDAVEVLQVR